MVFFDRGEKVKVTTQINMPVIMCTYCLISHVMAKLKRSILHRFSTLGVCKVTTETPL